MNDQPSITTIHLVRHGEVDNPTGVLYGQRSGFHLTQLGREMAEGLAQAFYPSHDIRAVITSPLERAIETGTPTAQAFGLELSTTADLIEAGNKFEGLPINDNHLMVLSPRFWPWYANPFEPSWGEPYVQIVARMSRAIRQALAVAEGGEAIVVSHQLPIWTMRRFIEGKSLAHDPRKRECSLCSVTSLTFVRRQLLSLDYWEPVGELLARAQDMVPGTSVAAEKRSH
ncbi:MAG: histidine phosphatase family protein [Actinomycetaceae bacterium]|nr:histidine phosphatase family protein [Actinomycetaceae bacterium]MDY5854189.1 histidine phosphatase family protein [Arcanobacterium sp.]